MRYLGNGMVLDCSEDVLEMLGDEVERQDHIQPDSYTPTRDGVFLAIATAMHELDKEAVEAWRTERCKSCGTPHCTHSTWTATQKELLQAAAVLVRVIRTIEEHNRDA